MPRDPAGRPMSGTASATAVSSICARAGAAAVTPTYRFVAVATKSASAEA